MSNNDANQIRELADAIRDLERALGPNIAGELESIASAIRGLNGVAQTPARELNILLDALRGFPMIAGVSGAIIGIASALKMLTLPKVLAIAGTIYGIATAVRILGRAFGDATGPAEDFAESLTGLTHLEKLQHLQELTKRLEELDQAWAAALDPDISTIELLEGMVGLEGGARDLHREITALEEMVGIFDQGQLDAAINTAKMEEAIGDAAGAISNLKGAYQEAFDAAYASINAQLGLFDRLNFEASKSVGEMATTWGGQAADITQHNDNLLFAIETNLLPGIVSSFQDINQAGHLDEVIASIRDAGYEMVDGEKVLSAAAQEIVDNLNSAFEEQLNAREALAETIAGMQVDLEAGAAEIVQGFTDMVGDLDLSDETREAGLATIQALIDGMESQEGALGSALDGIFDAMIRALESNSPSCATTEIGKETVDGLIQGAESQQGNLTSAYETLGKVALQALEEASVPQAESVGAQIPEVISTAIADGQGCVTASVDAMTTEIQQKFEEMKEQCDTITRDMMKQVEGVIVSQSAKIKNARVSLQRFGTNFFGFLTTPATVFSSSQTLLR